MIAAFNKKYPNVKVKYKPVGNNLPTVLATAVAGGHPPDMADIAQPGLVKQFAQQGKLKPITLREAADEGELRAGVVAARHVSTASCTRSSSRRPTSRCVWYNVPAFKTAGVKPPKTWPQLLKAAKTLKASGAPAYSIGGADGWTLTDLFENIYLRTFGAAKYDALTTHKIKWTDPSVKTALTAMALVVGDTRNIAGGTSGALQTGFNDLRHERVRDAAEGGDGVRGRLRRRRDPLVDEGEADHRLQPSHVPDDQARGSNASAVEIGGDRSSRSATRRRSRRSSSSSRPRTRRQAWAKLGGFATGQQERAASVYPDAITRDGRGPDREAAKSVVFDMSDQQPARSAARPVRASGRSSRTS